MLAILKISDHFYAFFNVFIVIIALDSCEFHIIMRNCDVSRAIIEVQGAQIARRSIDDPLTLIEGSPFSSLLCDFCPNINFFFQFISLLISFLLFSNHDISLGLFFLFFLVIIIFFVFWTWVSNDLNIIDFIVS